jgi:2-phospho-L-lactate guanylyltransferase
MTAIRDRRTSVVVLAKDSRFAKTRLGLPREEARRLAVHLAGSTVRAALAAEAVGTVLVVTGDPAIARDAVRRSAEVVAEPRPLGMNRAAELGRRRALELRPHAPVAIVVADLPALRPSDVDAVLTEFLRDGAPLFVADAEGVGTTFLVHGPDRPLGYGFGRGSAAMHHRLGYVPAGTSPYALCHDLDTPEDLVDLADLVAPERLVAS